MSKESFILFIPSHFHDAAVADNYDERFTKYYQDKKTKAILEASGFNEDEIQDLLETPLSSGWSYEIQDVSQKKGERRNYALKIVSLYKKVGSTLVFESNIIYNKKGKVCFQVDFAPHSSADVHWHSLVHGQFDRNASQEAHSHKWTDCPWVWLCVPNLENPDQDFHINFKPGAAPVFPVRIEWVEDYATAISLKDLNAKDLNISPASLSRLFYSELDNIMAKNLKKCIGGGAIGLVSGVVMSSIENVPLDHGVLPASNGTLFFILAGVISGISISLLLSKESREEFFEALANIFPYPAVEKGLYISPADYPKIIISRVCLFLLLSLSLSYLSGRQVVEAGLASAFLTTLSLKPVRDGVFTTRNFICCLIGIMLTLPLSLDLWSRSKNKVCLPEPPDNALSPHPNF